MKKIRIRITNYRGIATMDLECGSSGAIAKGRNCSGKTTLLNAFRAALEAQDIGADAIRKGADKSEILVDLDDVNVRRAITKNGTTLTVSQNGMVAKAPQTYLRETLGISGLDALELLLAKKPDRKAAVLAAIPVAVTFEQLRKWVPTLKEGFDCSGHGLEVIGRLHSKAYDQRAESNKIAKYDKTEAARLAQEAATLAQDAPAQMPDVDGMASEAVAAKTNLDRLRARAEEYTRRQERTAAQRARIADLHDQALRCLDTVVMVSDDVLRGATEAARAADAEIVRLREELEVAELKASECQELQTELEKHRAHNGEATRKRVALQDQAADIEAALASASVEPVSDDELAGAKVLCADVDIRLAAGRHAAAMFARHLQAVTALNAANQKAEHSESEAKRLDAIVKALADDAPTELLASSDGIPGLTIEGDDILLDGVKLDACSGMEKVTACVEVARRANRKSKILIVDELERLDPEQYAHFVKEATRDGYRLIGTRVEAGDMIVEAIEAEDPANASK